MKKFLIYATALFAAVSFGACSDNGHENETDLSQLYGTWQQTRTYGYELEDGQKSDQWDEVVDEEALFTVNEGGTATARGEGWSIDIRYTQSGNRLQMTCTTDDGETFDCTWTIEELTETRMKATQYTKETYEGSVCEEFDTMLFERVK